MIEWKRPLFIGIGWGLGTAVGLVILVGGFLWYESRPKPPKPPKPWNVAAIKAEYDDADTEGDGNTLVVSYTLENTTDFDYRADESQDIMFNSTLDREKSLLSVSNLLKINYPIVIPAKKRVSFKVHIDYHYTEKEKENADLQERTKHKEGVEKFLATEMANLGGFDLLDAVNRYEIIFPAGWKHKK